jgi:hypothetical protein
MPPRLNAPPVLSLDRGKMHHIDPSNACSLMAMWSIFSKCSETLEEGPRLENLSWRVWSRESLCVTPIDNSPRASQVPSLSNSFSSSESLPEMRSIPLKIRHGSKSPSHEDCASSLSKSRHLSPDTLEKIVATIQDQTGIAPLSPSLEASPPFTKMSAPEPKHEIQAGSRKEVEVKDLRDSTDSCLSNTTAATMSTQHQSEHRDSNTSMSSDGLIRSGSIVHGFSPVSSSCRPRTISSSLKPTTTVKPVPQPKSALKGTAMFTLGGSSEDDESSFEQRVLSVKAAPQRSSLSQSLSRQNLGGKTQLQPKRTSFRDVVAQRRIHEDAENDEGAIASSDEEDDTDEVIESAIDEDEEDGDWEDSNSDDGNKSQEPHLFRRVDSRPDLVSRRSMLTLALNKGQGGLAHAYSQPALYRSRQTSPPQGPSIANSPDDDDDGGMVMQTANRPPISIPPPKSNKSMAHSARTARLKMLSTELTESLRRNLLLERQEKFHTANAFLRRNRNAQSMANLTNAGRATGGPPPVLDPTRDREENWTVDNTWEYHSKGW